MKLDHQPGYRFSALTTPTDIAEVAPLGASFEFYNVALNVGEPIDAARLTSLVQERDVFLWRMQPEGEERTVAYLSLSRYAMAEQVYVLSPKGWDNTVVAAGLEALTQAVFREVPACRDIWTCLPLPEPEDGEETLAIMGFSHVPASLDKKRRRTFGLGRDVFQAYHEG